MKRYLRLYLYNLITFWLIFSFTPLLTTSNRSLFLAALTYTLLTTILKPVITLVMLPINLATFGLFAWAPTTITLYCTTLIASDFHINRLYLPSYHLFNLITPPLKFGLISTLVVTTILLHYTRHLILWTLRKNP